MNGRGTDRLSTCVPPPPPRAPEGCPFIGPFTRFRPFLRCAVNNAGTGESLSANLEVLMQF